MAESQQTMNPRTKVPLYVPFGARNCTILSRRCKKENISAEEVLLDLVIEQLRSSYYSEKDIEWVLEHDNLHEQVATWMEKNRKMLSFGGAVYATLDFSVSQREIVEVN